MEARQNEIKTIKEIVLQSNSLGGCEGRGELAINGKKAGTIINLPCPSFLPHFYCISMHGEKNAPKRVCSVFSKYTTRNSHSRLAWWYICSVYALVMVLDLSFTRNN